MEDNKIVDLYWARNELAIHESDRKYGRMLTSLSFSLLSSREDAEECVNDTYLDAWGAMPTARPTYLGAFLSKITRRISIDRFRAEHREKRGGMGAIVEELTEAIPDRGTPAEEYENGRLAEALNRFLRSQSPQRRAIFVRRYFYSQPVSQIAVALKLGESKVKVTLHRMREALRKELEAQDLL
ncbi:MAG: sigma-70 family RNA polymerase sigma factor [Clostridia bacterium]|nr:sigma-70 family RNA polymerase sigma factor [Clostridia bacterium]